MSTSLRPAVVAAAALVAIGCRDDVTTAPERQLHLTNPNASVTVESPSIYLLSVEVQGEGVDPGFFYDIPLQGGKSKLNLTLPAGTDRQIRLRGYDQYGQVTHQTLVSFPKVGAGTNEPLKVTLNPVREGKPVTAAFSVVGEVPLKGLKMVFKQSKAVYEGSQGFILPILIDEFGEHELDPRNVQWGVGDPIGGRIEPGTPYAYYTAAKTTLNEFQKFSACTFGRCFFGQIQNLVDPFIDVRAGEYHTCALRESGKVFCWGLNNFGQIGAPLSTASSNRPSAVTGTWKQVTVGGYHTCGINANGSGASCWGSNYYGQLGGGPSAPGFGNVPTPVAGGIAFSQLTAGWQHTCGIDTQNNGFCWGDNYWYQLGVGTFSPIQSSDHPLAISNSVKWAQLSAGSLTTCGVNDKGATLCWGDPSAVGHAPTGNDGVPQGTYAAATAQLSIGGSGHTCLIDATTHETKCWGSNGSGQVGAGFVSGSPNWAVASPTTLAGTFQSFTMVATSPYSHTCAVNTSNDAYCWGNNNWSQLGTGAAPVMYYPTLALVITTLKFTRIAAGHEHTCALTTDGLVACWGNGSSGQLGNATNGSSTTPVMVAP